MKILVFGTQLERVPKTPAVALAIEQRWPDYCKWMLDLKEKGTIEWCYAVINTLPDEATVAVFEVESYEQLSQLLHECPMFPYLQFDMHHLSSFGMAVRKHVTTQGSGASKARLVDEQALIEGDN